MSDTVKLIIEIPKDRYTDILRIADVQIVRRMPTLEQVIANGTLLDSNSERAEVQAYFDGQAYGWEEGRKALIDDVKAEIDKQEFAHHQGLTHWYMTPSEVKSVVFEILDNIGKAESEEKPNDDNNPQS